MAAGRIAAELVDGAGHLWALAPDLTIAPAGPAPAFDMGLNLDWMPPAAVTLSSLGGRQFEVSGPSGQFLLSAQYSRKAWVPEDRPWIRLFDTLANTGDAPLTASLSLTTDLGGQAGPSLVAETTGDGVLSPADTWLIAADAQSPDRPAAAIVLGDGAGPPRIATRQDDVVWMDWKVTLDPGQAVSILTFAAQGDPETLVPLARSLAGGIDAAHLTGLTTAERARVVNRDLAATPADTDVPGPPRPADPDPAEGAPDPAGADGDLSEEDPAPEAEGGGPDRSGAPAPEADEPGPADAEGQAVSAASGAGAGGGEPGTAPQPPSGTPGPDRVSLEGSTQAFRAGAGDDHVTGAAPSEALHGQLGSDTLVGGAGDDTLHGGAHWDLLFGNGGDDLLHGGGRGDRLAGGWGDDTLFGGIGNDRLSGADGADLLVGGPGDDLLEGGAWLDTLLGGAGDDTLAGGHRGDWIEGGAGADALDGGWGWDVLRGGPGADTLDAGGGRDRMVGGAGEDRFVLAADRMLDRIVDFTPGADRLDLGAFDLAEGADLSAHVSVTDAGLQVAFAGQAEVLLVGLTELAPSDVIF